jgi:hypothetical protein
MKFFLLYVVMVGVPAIFVIGLLQMGRDLKAPASVHGVWTLDLPASGATGACGSGLSWNEAPNLIISQSGPYISLTFNDGEHTKFDGILKGTEISGETIKKSAESLDLQIIAEIDRQVEPDRVQIALKLRGCDESISLVGTRLPGTQGSGSH